MTTFKTKFRFEAQREKNRVNSQKVAKAHKQLMALSKNRTKELKNQKAERLPRINPLTGEVFASRQERMEFLRWRRGVHPTQQQERSIEEALAELKRVY